MRRYLILALVLILIILGILIARSAINQNTGTNTGTNQNQTNITPQENATEVSIKNNAFNPAEIKISKGDTVLWTNNDSVNHTVTGTGFDSGTIVPGAGARMQFTSAGTYNYHCSIHPASTGKIIVE
ncbi:MAG: cupredoxin family copper-binding protein [Patescibacteria group bacterium]